MTFVTLRKCIGAGRVRAHGYRSRVRPKRLLERLKGGDVQNVSFADCGNLVEALGFELDRVHGSHHVFRQLLALVERYDLTLEVADYHINVFWSDEDGCYVADIPDLAFCSALGESPEEALRQVLGAKEAWLRSARERGDRIPDPRYRPAAQAGG